MLDLIGGNESTLFLAGALGFLWAFGPTTSPDTDAVAFRVRRLLRQAVPAATRNVGETAVYRSVAAPHDAPLVYAPWAEPGVPQGFTDRTSLWDVVSHHLRTPGTNETVEVVGDAGKPLTYNELYTQVKNLGSALRALVGNTDNDDATPRAPVLNLLAPGTLGSELANLACIGYGLSQLVPAEPITPAALVAYFAATASERPAVILAPASAHAVLAAASLQHVPVVIPQSETVPAGFASVSVLETLAAAAPASGVREPTPLAPRDKWVNDFVAADALAALAGVAAATMRADQLGQGYLTLVERSEKSTMSSTIYLMCLLSRGPSILLTRDPISPALLTSRAPHLAVTSTSAGRSALSQSLASLPTSHLASLTWPLSAYARQHLSAVRRAGVRPTYAEMLPLQRLAFGESFRGKATGEWLREVVYLLDEDDVAGTDSDDETWAALAGVSVVRAWGPRAVLGCTSMTAGAGVIAHPETDGWTTVGAVLTHAELKLVAGDEAEAAHRRGKVWVRTSTGTGARGTKDGWVRTAIDGEIAESGVLRVKRG
ncbi:hypothetical protein H9P43_004696 [Blastocladiella emersonii ATCC 22665]|nr:hypothetical protein H9P43_004696 [Blastocladiella emersonii ATCC 22665]